MQTQGEQPRATSTATAAPPNKLESTSWNPLLEEEVRRIWGIEDNFKFRPSSDKKRNFVMDTPPPYPSGKPWHPGALTQYAQIDMVARAARMRGFNVLYPIGIDRNGLPVEIATERKYRIQMRKTPREEFIGLCKHALDDIEAYMVDLLKRMGISGDFKEKYRTDSEEYRTLTQWSFIELWNKGLVHIANEAQQLLHRLRDDDRRRRDRVRGPAGIPRHQQVHGQGDRRGDSGHDDQAGAARPRASWWW